MITVIRNGEIADLTAEEIAEFEAISVEQQEKVDRIAKRQEIFALAEQRAEARIPGVGSENVLKMIVGLVQSGMMQPPDPGTDGWAVREIYVFARDRAEQAMAKPIEQVRAYDPASDPLFPV